MTSTTRWVRRLLLAAGACAVVSGCGGGSGDGEEPTPPAAPSGLTATAAGHSRVDLAWTDRSADETGFRIERSSTSATAGFAALHAVAAGETLWADTTVSPSTRYWYRVCATNAAGDSAWSNVADATTGPSPVVAPSDLAAVATGPNSVELTWVDRSSNEDGFELQRSATSAAAGFAQIALEAADSTSAGDGSVSPGTTYWYRIRAYNTDGTSGWSNVASVTTPTGAPGAPTGVVATAASSTEVTVSWTAPSAGNPTSYTVEWRTGGGIWNYGCSASATFCTVPGLLQSTTYEFHVIAHNAFGPGPASPVASATTPSGLPGAPTGVGATATSPTAVDVSWTAPSGSPTSYTVEYRTGGGIWNHGCTASGTFCAVSGLLQSTAYEFRVRAHNDLGTGPWSATTASATTPSGLPGAPTNLVATAASADKVELTWTAPTVGPVDGYYIEYSPAGTGWVAWGYASGTSQTITPLLQETRYDFRVTAYNNAFGYGPPSAPAGVTTPSGRPGAPTNLVATATSADKVELTWTAPAVGLVEGYYIEYSVGGTGWVPWGYASGTTQTITPLLQETQYDFRVTAYNNAFGYGPPSTPAGVTTPSGRPGAPTGLVATATSSTSVDLSWNAPASGDPSQYEVQYRVGGGLWFSSGWFTATSVTITPLVSNTAYDFQVRAFDAVFGFGPFSNVASATTLP
jgi:titin